MLDGFSHMYTQSRKCGVFTLFTRVGTPLPCTLISRLLRVQSPWDSWRSADLMQDRWSPYTSTHDSLPLSSAPLRSISPLLIQATQLTPSPPTGREHIHFMSAPGPVHKTVTLLHQSLTPTGLPKLASRTNYQRHGT